MASHFYGNSYGEHYEKDVKDFTTSDWIVTGIFFAAILAVFITMLLQAWGLVIISFSVIVAMIDVMLRVIFHTKSKIMYIFDVLAGIACVGGIIVMTGNMKWIITYVIITVVLVYLGVGVLFSVLAISKSKKIEACTLAVEARCEIVEIRDDNMLIQHSGNVNRSYESSSYEEQTKKAVLVRPSFHYFVNDKEYYTESKVYYGDLNKGFSEGARVCILVNPEDPTQILPQNMNATIEIVLAIGWWGMLIFLIGIMAVVCVVHNMISAL